MVVIKSGEKNKPMDQGGRGGGRRDEKKPAKINRGDDSPTRPLGVEITRPNFREVCIYSQIFSAKL